MLADKIAYYKETGKTLHNTPAQYKKDFPWLKEVDSLALCNVQLDLQKAYKNFFQSGFGFPKFKKNVIINPIRQITKKVVLQLLLVLLNYLK